MPGAPWEDLLNSRTLRTIVVSGLAGAVIGVGTTLAGITLYANRLAAPLLAQPRPEAVFEAAVGGTGIAGLTAPEGARIELLTGAAGALPEVRLSGVQSNASANGAPGIYLRLPDAFERAASGRTVRVTVVARRAAESPSRSFAVAYSTSEVGNSGWRRFTATAEPARHAFVYDVRPMAKGFGDFIGILPDTEGTGGAVQISAITAEILPQGSPLVTSSIAPADEASPEDSKVDFIGPGAGTPAEIKLTTK